MSRRAGYALLLGLASLAVFSPTVSFPFLDWDDQVNIAGNALLSFDGPGLRWMLTGSSLGHWHPLTWFSLALDRALWGPGPAGVHATNVILHALNAVLLFLVGRRLLAAEGPALLAALLWALHPLRVESVAWASERRDVLSGALALGCVLAHLAACDEPRGRTGGHLGRTNGHPGRADGHPGLTGGRLGWSPGRLAWLALGLGTLAMTAKVFCVVLPLVLLVVDARLGRGPRWKEKLPYLAPAALALWLNVKAQALSGAAVPLASFGLGARLAQAAYGLSFPALRTAWPEGLSPLHERSVLLEPWVFAVGAAASVLLGAGVWALRRREPGLAQAALAYLILLLPCLGLFKSGRMTAAERWSYLPAMPLSLALAAAAHRLPERVWRAWAAAALAGLALATLSYLPVWSGDEALWERACQGSPLSYFARVRLSGARQAAGRAVEAGTAMREASGLHRAVFEAAAEAYARRGLPGAAEEARLRAARGLELRTPLTKSEKP